MRSTSPTTTIKKPVNAATYPRYGPGTNCTGKDRGVEDYAAAGDSKFQRMGKHTEIGLRLNAAGSRLDATESE